MINLETTQTYPQTSQGVNPTAILIAGLSDAEKLCNELQGQGLECHFMSLPLESDANAGGFTYQQLSPALSKAEQMGLQMVIVAQPSEYKLSVGIRKQPDAPFQLLNVHQLAVLLAHSLANQAAEQDFACLRSVVVTDMLDGMLHRQGYTCKADVVDSETLESAGKEMLAATNVSEVMVVTEKGEFWSNKGFLYLVEKLVSLEQDLAAEQQSIFDRMMSLYYTYGYFKEKALAVTLLEENQAVHYNGLVEYFRKTKTGTLASLSIKEIVDYKNLKVTNFLSKKQGKLVSKPADMLKVVFEEGITLMFVPAPDKMFLYLSISGKLMNQDSYKQLNQNFEQRLMRLLELLNKIKNEPARKRKVS